MRVVCVIPARLESTRLPGKVLLAETGKPLILHTIEAAQSCKSVHHVIVATDSDILKQMLGFAVRVDRTGPANCGTDRIASIVGQLNADLIVNLQSDEPEIKPEHITALVEAYQQIPGCDMATLATEPDPEDFDNMNVVKVGLKPRSMDAMWFERMDRWSDPTYRHVGVYAYSPRFLKWYTNQPQSAGENSLRLEQDRAMSAGCRIRVAIVDHPYHGIDTREQYDAFVARWRAKQ